MRQSRASFAPTTLVQKQQQRRQSSSKTAVVAAASHLALGHGGGQQRPAALLAAGGQHLAAGRGGHARTEAADARPLPAVSDTSEVGEVGGQQGKHSRGELCSRGGGPAATTDATIATAASAARSSCAPHPSPQRSAHLRVPCSVTPRPFLLLHSTSSAARPPAASRCAAPRTSSAAAQSEAIVLRRRDCGPHNASADRPPAPHRPAPSPEPLGSRTLTCK